MKQRQTVGIADPDFSIREADHAMLLTVQRDNVFHRRSTRWSSEEALAEQVDLTQVVLLCPLYRNGGASDEQESYKCWLWYAVNATASRHGLTLLDISADLFLALPELSGEKSLLHVVARLMESIAQGSQFETLT